MTVIAFRHPSLLTSDDERLKSLASHQKLEATPQQKPRAKPQKRDRSARNKRQHWQS